MSSGECGSRVKRKFKTCAGVVNDKPSIEYKLNSESMGNTTRNKLKKIL